MRAETKDFSRWRMMGIADAAAEKPDETDVHDFVTRVSFNRVGGLQKPLSLHHSGK